MQISPNSNTLAHCYLVHGESLDRPDIKQQRKRRLMEIKLNWPVQPFSISNLYTPSKQKIKYPNKSACQQKKSLFRMVPVTLVMVYKMITQEINKYPVRIFIKHIAVYMKVIAEHRNSHCKSDPTLTAYLGHTDLQRHNIAKSATRTIGVLYCL